MWHVILPASMLACILFSHSPHLVTSLLSVSPFYLLALSPLYLLSILLKNLYTSHTLTKTTPTAPGATFILGHVIPMLTNTPWDIMTSWHTLLGPIYNFTLFTRPCVSVTDPVLLKAMLHTHHNVFKKDLKFTYKPFLCLLGQGLVTSEGRAWRDQRTRLSSALRIDILEEIPEITLRAVQRLTKEWGDGGTVEMGECFRRLTLQVISEAILSLDPGESDRTFAVMYLPIVDEGNKRVWNPALEYGFMCSSWWKHRANCRELDQYIITLVVARKALRVKEASEGGGRRLDILDRIILSYEKMDMWNGAVISQIRDEIKTFILAGHETSAAMLTWAQHEMVCGANSAELRDKIRREGDAIWKDTPCATWDVADLPSRTEQLSKLVYSEACLKEALRRYSVVPTVTRTVSENIEVGGHRFLKGTTVMIGIQGVHEDERWWKDAKVYDPERFMEGGEGMKGGKSGDYTFIPFIEGPRNCLGQYLALLETKMVLSLLMKDFHFEPVGGMVGGEKHPYMVPVVPKDGIVVMVTKRKGEGSREY